MTFLFAKCFQSSSMLSHVSFFLFLFKDKWYYIVWIEHILFVHLLAGGYLGHFHFWLLWIMLLWVFVHNALCRHIFSVLTGAHLGVKSLGHLITLSGFPGGSVGKESACSAGDPVRSVGREGPLEKEMATPPQYSCLGNPMDRRTWWATVHGIPRVGHNLVTKSTFLPW